MRTNIVAEFRRAVPSALLDGATTNTCGDLVIELRAPGPDDRALLIQVDVDCDEVIVAFGGGHSHGGAWRGAQDPDHRFGRSLRLIDEIRAERVVGYRLGNGGGGLVGVDDIGDLPPDATIRSWRSRYDRDGAIA